MDMITLAQNLEELQVAAGSSRREEMKAALNEIGVLE